MTITVFTPTYNRAYILPKLYESLCRQTCKDFEWIVVDDGSTDETKNIVSSWVSDARFSALKAEPAELVRVVSENEFIGSSIAAPWLSIHYIWKGNGGKHRAINRGVREAKGELFFIVDSDDSVPETAIADILEQYNGVADDATIGGVSGLVAHHDGELIGSGYPKECEDASSIEQRFKYGVKGDLAEVFRTTVMREFPFPEIEGEKFCPEQLVWYRIAQKYRLKCFNKVISYRDYLDGGLTDNIVRIRMKSPIASMICYAELTRYDVPFIQKVKAAINYWRFRSCSDAREMPTIHWQWSFVIPIAYLMHLRDLKMVNG